MATSCPLKKNPSQTAQAETPKPLYLCSLSKPSHLAVAPVAIITVSAVTVLFFVLAIISTQIIYYAEGETALTNKFQPQIVNNGLTERIQVWTDSIKIWKKYPILGAGPENFASELKLVNEKDFNTNQNWSLFWHKAHNQLVHFLATVGLVGLLSHLFLAFFVFYSFFKTI